MPRRGKNARSRVPRKPRKNRKALTLDSLRTLRVQLGTKELARRMGIPAPSLRRLLGSGKGAGLPKRTHSAAFEKLTLQVSLARMMPEKAQRLKAKRKIQKAIREGYFEEGFADIADELGLEPREVYTLGMSPGQLGEVA